MNNTLTIRKPDDFHFHGRQGEMLKLVLPYAVKHFGRVLFMPNTDPPLTTGQLISNYHQEISNSMPEAPNFEALKCLYLTDDTTDEIIKEAYKHGAVACKLYLKGATTGSGYGVSDVKKLASVFDSMQKIGLILSMHGEMPDMHSDHAEIEFYKEVFWWIYLNFPKLKMVWEHVTTAEMVKLLQRYDSSRVAATITAHHLVLNRDDVFGNPYNYCRPPAKSKEDQIALINAAISGDPRFFFGSDNAPHPVQNKRALNFVAGCYSPNVLTILAEVFERVGKLDKLEDFTSSFGADFYGLPRNTDTITFKKIGLNATTFVQRGDQKVGCCWGGEYMSWYLPL